MREISLYKQISNYVVGQNENIPRLIEKLKNDELLLKEIENDYSSNQDKYKTEYLTAKQNFLKNYHFYNYFILFDFYQQTFAATTFSFPDFHKEEMKKKGWIFPQYFINKKITNTGGYPETTEETYIRNFNQYFDFLFDFCIGQHNSRIDRYYKQAKLCYRNGCYYSCAVALFPIIESMHQNLTNFNEDEFYRIKDNLNKVDNSIKEIQPFKTKVDYYIKLVDQFNDLCKNHYFKKSLSRNKEPEIINRNRIMHGLFSREISQKDCLQLFCVISSMNTLQQITTASEQIKNLPKEINKISLELKNS